MQRGKLYLTLKNIVLISSMRIQWKCLGYALAYSLKATKGYPKEEVRNSWPEIKSCKVVFGLNVWMRIRTWFCKKNASSTVGIPSLWINAGKLIMFPPYVSQVCGMNFCKAMTFNLMQVILQLFELNFFHIFLSLQFLYDFPF